jgi:hypothetical protein
MNRARHLFALVLFLCSFAICSEPFQASPSDPSTTRRMFMSRHPTLMHLSRAFSAPSEARARSRRLPR